MKNVEKFNDYIQLVKDEYNAVGIAVSIFDLEKDLFKSFIGTRDGEKPIDGDTIFGVASITKSFTALAILKLYEEGIIDIYDNIDNYIEGLNIRKEQMPKIYHLLSHTGGFLPQKRLLIKNAIRELNIKESKNIHKNIDIQKYGIEKIVEQLNNNKEFTGLPGQYMSYSNDGYGLLTEIIRKYGGENSYVDYIKKNIINPLGLKNTFFDFNRANNEKNIANLYKQNNGEVERTKDFMELGYILMGGGGLKSSVNDLKKYTRMFIREDEIIISKKHIQEMLIPKAGYKPLQYYGYGLITGFLDDISYAGHSGGLPGVSSFFGFSKDINKGIVVLCNTSGVPSTSIGISGLRMSNNRDANTNYVDYKDCIWDKELINNTIGTYSCDEGICIDIFKEDSTVKFREYDKISEIRTVQNNLILVKNKLEWNTVRILRNKENISYAIYVGSRLLLKRS